MKRAYQKPYLAIELFQLSAAFAASCSSSQKVPLNMYISTCYKDSYDGEEITYVGNACPDDILSSGIDTEPTHQGDDNDQYCYQGPIDPYAVFLKS